MSYPIENLCLINSEPVTRNVKTRRKSAYIVFEAYACLLRYLRFTINKFFQVKQYITEIKHGTSQTLQTVKNDSIFSEACACMIFFNLI